MIRCRIAYILRAIAEALELQDDDTDEDYARPTDAQRPDPLSEPFDPIGLWRDVTIDYGGGADTDEWRLGSYL